MVHRFVEAQLGAFRQLARVGGLPLRALPGAGLLDERAAISGYVPQGRTSPGGSFRILRMAGGRWLGLNLARPTDLASVPALTLGALPEPDGDRPDWPALDAWAAGRDAESVYAQALLLDIPVALVDPEPARVSRLRTFPRRLPHGTRLPDRAPCDRPLVADLSALWAGPLCAHLLGLAGGRVLKIESTARPDGARRGPAAFFDLLHGGHEAVAFDFADPAEIARLRALLTHADIVIEASRPRALAQLGVRPAEIAAERPGQTWVSITAYGRTGQYANRPGFGDDVAAAAGLVGRTADGAPAVYRDAVADPLTGVHAAVAALTGYVTGGGVMFDVRMHDTAALAAAYDPDRHEATPPANPTRRPVAGRAPRLGEHTEAVLTEFGICPA